MIGEHLEYDWLVIGSGFGGSTGALRLAEKGYRVGVLECGRRFADEDFAKTTWDAAKYYWMPKLGMKGIFRLTLFKDIFVASGCGVGGGSLGYANTLYRARPAFYTDPQIAGLADWEAELAPHYAEAERMLGVVSYDQDTAADLLLKEYAQQHGFGDTYVKTPVGVYLGEEGKTVPDPFFGGEGPARTGCVRCGRCMIGCRHGAKNTLVKNYLYLAERHGARVMPERSVCDVRPLRAGDGSDGYVVTHERSGAWVRRDRRRVTRARRDRRGGRVGYEQAAVQLQAARVAAGHLRSARVSRAHQQRIDLRGYRSRRRARLHPRRGDHLQRAPRSRHAHRAGHLR